MWFLGNLQHSHLALSSALPNLVTSCRVESAEIQGELKASSSDPVVICSKLSQFVQFGQEISGTVIFIMGNNLCIFIMIIGR